MQANKNGFFYVLDRRTGKLISAKDYAYVTWASGIDMATGRPVLTPAADWYTAPSMVYPSWAGAHTWNATSFNPGTGLVYIPVVDVPAVWVDMAHNGGSVTFLNGFFTANGIFPDDNYDAAALAPYYGPLPDLKTLASTRPVKLVRELLRAWDPVAQKTAWEHETSTGIRGYDGGVMSTAGNLVFQGRGTGELWVYAADSGKVLKVIETGSHIMAAPMTYAVDGEQFVAVQVGYGGTNISGGPFPPSSATVKYQNVNRIIAFKLGGGAVPKPAGRDAVAVPKPPETSVTEAQIRHGEIKFIQQCSRCHALGPSVTPDLRKMKAEVHDIFKDIVLGGAFAPNGMEPFDDLLSAEDVEAVHAYLTDLQRQAYEEQEKGMK
jgi:quinohemoprotein ethanol dehydrogenase